MDNIVGTAGNDTINANQVQNAGGTFVDALTALDSIDGGAGTDTMNLTTAGAVTIPTTATVKNVEIANITTAGALNGSVAGWTGLTKLNVVSATASVAGAVQAITAGGADVSLTTAYTFAAGTGTGAAVTVNGGKAVNIASTVGGNAVNTTNVGSAVNVNGTADTTSVSVTQTATVVAATAVVGTTAGAVTINDVNAGSLTKAATIASVTLNNYANSTISSNALSTLSLSGTAGTLGITSGLTTETVKTLNLTVNNLSGANTITDSSNHFTTIAVTGNTKASTIANIADSAATALTVAGDQVVTFTSLAGLSSLKTVAVSGAAGFAGDVSGIASVTGVDASATSGANTVTVKATQTTYIGGTGVDIVTIDAAPTKAIGGGAGIADELVLNVVAATFANPSANTNLTGFEVLGLGATAVGSYDATGFTGLHVGGEVAGVAKFTNVAAGTTLVIDASPTQDIFYVLKDATGTADVVALTIGKATTDGLNLALKAVDITGIESVTIASTGKAIAGSLNTLKLADTTATTSVLKNIIITGAQDMTLSDALTGTAKIVSLDASTATGAIDMSGMHVSAAGSTIKGSLTAANVLTGGAGADIITGGAKIDTITSGAGLDVLTGGAGADKFVMSTNANGNIYSTITDFTKTVGTVAGDSIDLSGLSVKALAAGVTALGTAVTLAPTAAFADFLNAAASGHATAGTTAAVVSWFQYSGDTYVVVDNNDADVFTSSVTTGDQVVKLTGLIDLSKAAISVTTELLTLA